MSVYVFYNPKNNCYKIGQSEKVGRRLREIKEQYPDTFEVLREAVGSPQSAESAAQTKVMNELGMRQVNDGSNKSDWFKTSQNVSSSDVKETVMNAISAYR
ncbi:unnamed protein product [Owenia fusiformis]|uniref:Uncharacterized protein n=1 Tax=Owenia fusiformis TaxID=6347 RepID=A0A8J1Y0Z3_OWEFU|nr:unnamed protein product [Owenia fusiformis]